MSLGTTERTQLSGLARRAGLPVELEVDAPRRLPDSVETAAYYVVSATLTNAAKHAQASLVHVHVHAADSVLDLEIAMTEWAAPTPAEDRA